MNEIKITNINGLLTVSSLQVAKDFGKEHKNVIQSIENLVKQTSAEFSADVKTENFTIKNMFIESTYTDKYGRLQKCYDITRDGFSLLVMGFTGKTALAWKIRYIEAFNIMESQLMEVHSNTNITLDSMLETRIENAVNRALDKKLEPVVKRALDKKFRSFNKSSNRKIRTVAKALNDSITYTVSETALSLVPYFDKLINIIRELLKF